MNKNKNKHLGICTCNNQLNVHTGMYVATGKAIVYKTTCNTCGQENMELKRNNKKQPLTKRESLYRSLRSMGISVSKKLDGYQLERLVEREEYNY